MTKKRTISRVFTNSGILVVGMLVVLLADILRFARAFEPTVDPTLDILRFCGLLIFYLGLLLTLLSMQQRTDLALNQHERMFGEIKEIQKFVGMRPSGEFSEWEKNQRSNKSSDEESNS